MRTSGLMGSRVQAQKLAVRVVSDTSRPTTLLNHWRSLSTSETIAIGTLKILHTCAEMPGVVGASDSQRVTSACPSAQGGARKLNFSPELWSLNSKDRPVVGKGAIAEREAPPARALVHRGLDFVSERLRSAAMSGGLRKSITITGTGLSKSRACAGIAQCVRLGEREGYEEL